MSRSLPLRALLGAAALSAASLLGAPAQAVPACGNQTHHDACGKGNIYPCCPNGGNCTWWAWESVCRSWHVGLVNWGNANTWAYYAAKSGWTVSSSPRPGAIAQTSKGRFGHVAIVEEVSADGTQIKYSDMNGLAGWNRVGKSWETGSYVGNGGWAPTSYFEHYIYR